MLRRRIAAAALAVGTLFSGGAALLAVTSAPAGASLVGDSTTAEQAGYAIGNGQFEKVVTNVYLRNAAQYSHEVTSFGDSVQLLTAGKQITLGISTTTTGNNAYSPGLAVFDRTGTAPTDLVFSGNGQFGSFSVPSGRSVQLRLYYSKATGVVHATVLDTVTGLAASATYDLGLGAKIVQARAGNEFGCYSDTDPRMVGTPPCGSDVTVPAKAVKLASFSGLMVQNYKNKNFTDIAGSYLTAAPILATSNGSASGTTLAGPGALSATGSFSVSIP
jgi:hypothetical protein